MYKIDIDPITNKIKQYTSIDENTPIYNDDLIVDDSELSEIINSEKQALLDSKKISSYEFNIKILNEKLSKLTREDEKDCLVRLLVDEMKDLSEVREIIKQRRSEIDELKKQIEIKVNEHETEIREYWIGKDTEADTSIAFKYYSSVILLIKDENRYLREWIDWHLNTGFDHIYIYDNGVKEKVIQILYELPGEIQNKITVIDWSGHHTHIQQDAYNHFLNTYKKEVRWGLFIDSDEFVKFTDGKTTNVNDFLKDYEDYTEIWGYEIEYNANGKEFYEDKPVKERFTKTVDVRDGYFWKNFVQVNRISHFTMHYAQYNDQKHFLFTNENRNSDLFVIEHYYTKSWEEWNRKIKERGGADPNYHKILSEFFIYNPDMKYLDTGEKVCQAYEGNLQNQ